MRLIKSSAVCRSIAVYNHVYSTDKPRERATGPGASKGHEAMKKVMLTVSVAVLAMLVIGCGGKDNGGGGTSKVTAPQQTLENMRLAMLAGDSEGFVACFDVSPEQETMLKKFPPFAKAASEYEAEMIKAYGKDAMGDGAVSTDMSDMKDENWLESVTITVDGDKAVAKKKGEDSPINLIKKNGVWKIADNFLMTGATDEEVEQGIKMIELMTKMFSNAKTKIGKEGYTAKKIQQEMQVEVMRSMMVSQGQANPETAD